MSDFDPPSTLMKEASLCRDPAVLGKLAMHDSIFVRARVAGNPYISEATHMQLLHDERPGVVLWGLGNKNMGRMQFEYVYQRLQDTGFDPLLHPVLAGCPLATLHELSVLMRLNSWGVYLGILNNHSGRDPLLYKELIAPLLPDPEKEESKWTEIEQRAFLRTFGTRLKPRNYETYARHLWCRAFSNLSNKIPFF